ncbi:MAG: lipid hydroperoxide peroxidase [Gammaproteobacteria bacterium]|nr:lipid hydroperoxide peroxidase [Gammaproteobacteria bacterium]
MTKITLKGNEIHTNGDIPKIGDEAPDFVLVNEDLNNVTLEDYKNKNKILSIVPSLDTPVCQTSTKVFNEKASSVKDTIILTISADLPFAMTRFCSSEKLNNIKSLSMMRSRNFAKDYGVLIVDGPLAGITARAVVVIDKNNIVIHSELVKEIADEPDYDGALNCLT